MWSVTVQIREASRKRKNFVPPKSCGKSSNISRGFKSAFSLHVHSIERAFDSSYARKKFNAGVGFTLL